MKKTLLIAFILFSFPLFGGCGETQSQEKTYESNKYQLSFILPKDWTVIEDKLVLNAQPKEVFSNFFSLEILDTSHKLKNLNDYIKERHLKKADFLIDGKEVYTDSLSDSQSGKMLYFIFENKESLYQLYMFEDWYKEMPEIKQMIASIKLK